jgi:hypothetical protein
MTTISRPPGRSIGGHWATQLALYVERQVTARRPDRATRVVMIVLSPWIEWRALLVAVKPDTLLRWHCRGFRLLWRCKSPRRPSSDSRDVQTLIAEMCDARTSGSTNRRRVRGGKGLGSENGLMLPRRPR